MAGEPKLLYPETKSLSEILNDLGPATLNTPEKLYLELEAFFKRRSQDPECWLKGPHITIITGQNRFQKPEYIPCLYLLLQHVKTRKDTVTEFSTHPGNLARYSEFIVETMTHGDGVETILHLALQEGRNDFIKSWHSHWTAIKTLEIHGFYDSNKLITKGKKPFNVTNREGLTPLDIAYLNDNKEAIKFLKENEAIANQIKTTPKIKNTETLITYLLLYGRYFSGARLYELLSNGRTGFGTKFKPESGFSTKLKPKRQESFQGKKGSMTVSFITPKFSTAIAFDHIIGRLTIIDHEELGKLAMQFYKGELSNKGQSRPKRAALCHALFAIDLTNPTISLTMRPDNFYTMYADNFCNIATIYNGLPKNKKNQRVILLALKQAMECAEMAVTREEHRAFEKLVDIENHFYKILLDKETTLQAVAALQSSLLANKGIILPPRTSALQIKIIFTLLIASGAIATTETIMQQASRALAELYESGCKDLLLENPALATTWGKLADPYILPLPHLLAAISPYFKGMVISVADYFPKETNFPNIRAIVAQGLLNQALELALAKKEEDKFTELYTMCFISEQQFATSELKTLFLNTLILQILTQIENPENRNYLLTQLGANLENLKTATELFTKDFRSSCNTLTDYLRFQHDLNSRDLATLLTHDNLLKLRPGALAEDIEASTPARNPFFTEQGNLRFKLIQKMDHHFDQFADDNPNKRAWLQLRSALLEHALIILCGKMVTENRSTTKIQIHTLFQLAKIFVLTRAFLLPTQQVPQVLNQFSDTLLAQFKKVAPPPTPAADGFHLPIDGTLTRLDINPTGFKIAAGLEFIVGAGLTATLQHGAGFDQDAASTAESMGLAAGVGMLAVLIINGAYFAIKACLNQRRLDYAPLPTDDASLVSVGIADGFSGSAAGNRSVSPLRDGGADFEQPLLMGRGLAEAAEDSDDEELPRQVTAARELHAGEDDLASPPTRRHGKERATESQRRRVAFAPSPATSGEFEIGRVGDAARSPALAPRTAWQLWPQTRQEAHPADDHPGLALKLEFFADWLGEEDGTDVDDSLGAAAGAAGDSSEEEDDDYATLTRR